ncbi:MAG: GTP-binding protein [Promethearchaeota archaeon]|nr:MAG: GTP-binding protein [Candidatus Lokiarchaeota archaeon]
MIPFAKFKVCVFGDGGVGKTTLVNRYLTGTFKGDYKITIGADFYIKKLETNNKDVTLQIWDFAGEDKFRFLLPTYASGSSGGIFMYDITRHSSIENVESWLEVFKKSFESRFIDIPLIMVGGKTDLEEKRVISKEEGSEMAKKYNFFEFIECSSKTGENVEEIFSIISRKMLDSAQYLK